MVLPLPSGQCLAQGDAPMQGSPCGRVPPHTPFPGALWDSAPGCRLTHARAGSGGTCVAPPPTRGALCNWMPPRSRGQVLGGRWGAGPHGVPGQVAVLTTPPSGCRSPLAGFPEVPPCSSIKKGCPCRWRRSSVPKPTSSVGIGGPKDALCFRAGGFRGETPSCTVSRLAGGTASAWP